MDMENANMVKVLSTSNEADMNHASDYLEECSIACTIKKTTANEAELWVAEKDGDKATSLIKDILPDYFAVDSEEDNDDEEEEAIEKVVNESNAVIAGIIGKIFLGLGIIAAVLGIFLRIPYIKIIISALAGLGILLNGYEGLKTQKTLPLLLCLVSIAVVVIGIFWIGTKTPASTINANRNSTLAQVMSSAGNYLTNKNYAKAIPLYEEALELAIKEENSPGEILTLSFLGAIYEQKSQFEKSLDYYNKALQRCEETGNASLADRISKLVNTNLKLESNTETESEKTK